VGVGAFVLNERREVLVVQEKNGALRGQVLPPLPGSCAFLSQCLVMCSSRRAGHRMRVLEFECRLRKSLSRRCRGAGSVEDAHRPGEHG